MEKEINKPEVSETSGTESKESSAENKGNIWVPIGIACGVVVCVVAFFITQVGMFSNKESGAYVGGNVLSMAYTGSTEDGWPEFPVVSTPWRYMHMHTGLMHRTLLLADSAFESTEPDLAKGFLISEDGLTYTIVMKDNVLWSDGTPITVDDVVFSIEAVLLAENTNSIITTAFSRIVGAEEHMANPSIGLAGLSVDGTALTIQLDEPYVQMEMVISQFAILPKHILVDTDWTQINNYGIFWHNPVVSGMYRTDVDHDGEFIKWVKNEYYEGEEPHIDEIHFIPDYKTSVDYYSTNNVDDLVLYRAMRGMVEYPVETLFFRYFIFNMEGIDGNQNEAMQDERVRKALGYAIDRESLLRKVYLDTGTIVDSGVPSSHSASVGSIIDVEYDPVKAKELLEEAQYDFSRPIRMTYYYTDSISISFLEGVAANFEAIGLTVDLFHVGEFDLSTSDFLYGSEGREYDLALKGYSAFSVYESYIEYMSTNETMNMLFGGVSKFEDPVSRLYASRSMEEAEEVLEELQMLEYELYYKLPLFTLNQTVFINTDRVEMPSGVSFGNTYYRCDIQFQDWAIKQE